MLFIQLTCDFTGNNLAISISAIYLILEQEKNVSKKGTKIVVADGITYIVKEKYVEIMSLINVGLINNFTGTISKSMEQNKGLKKV